MASVAAAAAAAPAVTATTTAAAEIGSSLCPHCPMVRSCGDPPRVHRVGLHPRVTPPLGGGGERSARRKQPTRADDFPFPLPPPPSADFLPTRDCGLSMVDLADRWLCAFTHRVYGRVGSTKVVTRKLSFGPVLTSDIPMELTYTRTRCRQDFGWPQNDGREEFRRSQRDMWAEPHWQVHLTEGQRHALRCMSG